ncbi:hypothetical protein [Flavobacterium sp.]|uniref:hypothetical protein n=1 Tax=Flavobacterium sp. TaxID=239 RepID=UPI003C35FECB
MKSYFNIKAVILLFLILLASPVLVAQSDSDKTNSIVSQMLTAMGGIENYNNTRFIQWEFGKRKMYWDKWTGDVRIESTEDNQCILMNINTLKGKAYANGHLVENEVNTKKLLNQAKNWWINDSYWLVMPWKLHDPGVTLKYVKTAKLPDGKMADILEMTFNAVGVTPNNKYWVYVDQEDHLLKQWSFFKNFNDNEPQFTKAWDNYQKTGMILLSFDRSKGAGGPKNVVVNTTVDSAIFTKL